MTRLELDEVFACPHLHVRINRRSCAARHKSFADKKRNPKTSYEGISSCCCRRCEVGAMHARGKRAPDVPLVQVVAKASVLRKRPRLCLGCGSPLPVNTIPRSDRFFGAVQRTVCGPTCASLASDAKRNLQQSQLPEWG